MAHHKVKDGELVEVGAMQIWLQSLWARLVGLGVSEVNLAECYGCGLCVSTCSGGARTMMKREGYRNRYYPIELISKASAPQKVL